MAKEGIWDVERKLQGYAYEDVERRRACGKGTERE